VSLTELLDNASNSLEDADADLRLAHTAASPVEQLVVIDLIGQVAKALQNTLTLLAAIERAAKESK
jgi:hypothetical protein